MIQSYNVFFAYRKIWEYDSRLVLKEILVLMGFHGTKLALSYAPTIQPACHGIMNPFCLLTLVEYANTPCGPLNTLQREGIAEIRYLDCFILRCRDAMQVWRLAA